MCRLCCLLNGHGSHGKNWHLDAVDEAFGYAASFEDFAEEAFTVAHQGDEVVAVVDRKVLNAVTCVDVTKEVNAVGNTPADLLYEGIHFLLGKELFHSVGVFGRDVYKVHGGTEELSQFNEFFKWLLHFAIEVGSEDNIVEAHILYGVLYDHHRTCGLVYHALGIEPQTNSLRPPAPLEPMTISATSSFSASSRTPGTRSLEEYINRKTVPALA